jgi:2-phosphosulfolactate phosphatase
MARVHLLTRKEDLDGERLPGKVVVVLDVLFATSSIVAALAHGAAEVVPTLDGEAALLNARGRAPGSFVLSGELGAVTLDGFSHPTPLALIEEGVAGKTLIYSTSNGTVALRKSSDAAHVYAGALLNGEALAAELDGCLDATVLLVCAGSMGNFNLEDFYGAGYLASLLSRGPHELSDAALAAKLLHDSTDAFACLSASRVGRLMIERGLEREVRFAAQKSRFSVVPRLAHGSLWGG